jgi:hypothetical protein
MNESYFIINLNTGERVAECGSLEDAKMMVNLNPANRGYRKNTLLLDQVIDVTSTTDKQLPGQLGLPAGKVNTIEPHKIRLPEGQQQPIKV